MIEADSLTKRYGARAAVQDVSFSCAPGTVTGFLGPNGAGKSTTLKMLCGLARASSGRCTVLGVPFDSMANPGRHVGVLIDASAAHSGRRGAETLATSAQLLGIPRTRVDEMLTLVGLDGAAAHKRVGQYSLGMRQRLGIAHALLGDPEVLILDEPANGLDPEGMRWMRGLLADFAGRGGTVLLSSHLLHEVEVIADRLIIISAGRIAAQGTREELAGAGGDTRVRSVDDGALRRALEQRDVTISVAEDGALLAAAEPAVVGDAALAAGVALRELGGSREGGLEQLFFRLTDSAPNGESRPAAARPPLPMPPAATPREEIHP
jgi:ABC-2 type transport system ATP-binding protein